MSESHVRPGTAPKLGAETAPVAIPAAVALAVGPRSTATVGADGVSARVDRVEARRIVERQPVILAHAGFTARRLGATLPRPAPNVLDALELFAFVRPATFAVPTIDGLAAVLGLPKPADEEAAAVTLLDGVGRLLADLRGLDRRAQETAAAIADIMGRGGWPWAAIVRNALAAPPPDNNPRWPALEVWRRLPRWEDEAPRPQPGLKPVSPAEAETALAATLGRDAEARPAQARYAAFAAGAFAPPDLDDGPHLLCAEAGTGIGKTLGYLAPASVWAARNDGAVWVSTYTKNLQRQIDQELTRLFPEPETKQRRAVVRKGRENYLCLLNFEDEVRRAQVGSANPVGLGFLARWAAATRDGDLIGGDLPGWLVDLMPPGALVGLTDRRGECIYSACEHYAKCFVERTVRRARKADIVVANHALVMAQAALGDHLATQDDDGVAEIRSRFVFDEGHHLFDAADSAFSAELSGREMAELRRWIRGAEGNARSRSRGIESRYGDLVEGIVDEDQRATAREALKRAQHAATRLPAEAWSTRLRDGEAVGPAEAVLHRLMGIAKARAPRKDQGPHGFEAELKPAPVDLIDAGTALASALAELQTALVTLAARLKDRLKDEADDLDTQTRTRLAAAARSLDRRAQVTVPAWIAMLKSLAADTPDAYLDWVEVIPLAPRIMDVAMKRHWIDPAIPFAQAVLSSAHGTLITSATLTDAGPAARAGHTAGATESLTTVTAADGDSQRADPWPDAFARTGVAYAGAPQADAFASPFDYPGRTQVMIVNDVRRDAADEVAAAYGALFDAAGGGALGLFTAINRLRAVHARIGQPLEEAGIPVLAQHVDPIDTGALVDIFRAEEDTCLLGTDAMRDGVDVPGRSLRLIVFDRVPWPRPTLLHKARRDRFGRAYDDHLTRLKLKQAYGRLIRRSDDRGLFVMLDAMMPSRLLTAFPTGVSVRRIGLKDAVDATRAFFQPEVPEM